MQFNKNQKIIIAVYCLLLLAILLFLTPKKVYDLGEVVGVVYKNFFTTPDEDIEYKKFYFELEGLTLFSVLALFVFKNPNKKTN